MTNGVGIYTDIIAASSISFYIGGFSGLCYGLLWLVQKMARTKLNDALLWCVQILCVSRCCCCCRRRRCRRRRCCWCWCWCWCCCCCCLSSIKRLRASINQYKSSQIEDCPTINPTINYKVTTAPELPFQWGKKPVESFGSGEIS